MRIDVVSIFPEYLAPLALSLVGKAGQTGLLDLRVHDLRQWTHDRHRTVDDTPYGGGAGMVMNPVVWGEAIDELLGFHAKPQDGPCFGAGPAISATPHPDSGAGPQGGSGPGSGADVTLPDVGHISGSGSGETKLDQADAPTSQADAQTISPSLLPVPSDDTARTHPVGRHTPRPVLIIPSPAGVVFTQALAERLSQEASWLIFACGRYEGIDARVAEHYAEREDVQVMEVSIGDYVLNGGEAAAMVIIEAVARLIPGVLGNPASLVEESHGTDGLLEYPVYTKPSLWRGLAVPQVLLSGDHGAVDRWRAAQAMERTCARRPDLIAKREADSSVGHGAGQTSAD